MQSETVRQAASPAPPLGELDNTIAVLTRAVTLDPRSSASWSMLGAAMLERRRYDDAIAAYSNALKLDPSSVAALSGLGVTLRRRALPTHALTFLNMAAALDPMNGQIRHERALAHLTVGDYAKGFADHEQRLVADADQVGGRPRWTGEPLGGRTLLVHADADVGQTIQFARYLPLVSRSDGRVLLRVASELVSLLSRIDGVDAVAATSDEAPPHDLTCPLANLPLLLGTTLQTIPSPAAYLMPDPARVTTWRARLAVDAAVAAPRLRVGLVCSSSLADLAGLAVLARASPDVHFYSLPNGEPGRDSKPPECLHLIDHTGLIDDLDDMAALLSLLDLVIGVDVASAHLAGALGRPVWLLSPYERCWWITDGNTTPWYDSMRVFAQPTPSDWSAPVSRMTNELIMLVDQSQALLLAEAYAHQQANRLQDAAEGYIRALEINPDLVEAHNNLGNILRQLDQPARAKRHFERALGLRPGSTGTLYNLGCVCTDLSDWTAAVAHFRQAAALQPDFADCHYNLANVLSHLRQDEQAIDAYRTAISLRPRFAQAHNNLGNALIRMGDAEQAIACLRIAIELAPDEADAYVNLGSALRDRNRLDEAAACLEKAIAINPGLRQAHNNLGTVRQAQGKLDAAASCFRAAIGLKPDYVESLVNLGDTLRQQEQFDAAAAAYADALELAPGNAPAHNGLGSVRRAQGALDAAVISYHQALALDRNYAQAHNNLGNALKDQGRLADAITHFGRALALKPDYVAAFSNELFTRNYLEHEPAEALCGLARSYGALVASGARPFTSWSASSGRPLRVGLVSSDLRNHPVGFFLQALLGEADPDRVTFLAFTSHHVEDELTARIKPWFTAWHSLVGLSDEAAARLIHATGVDILLDLTGHTAHNRLPVFAWRPAPVQAAWLGYFATTGVAEIDYVIADPHVAPPEEAAHFAEQLWRLPEIYYCFSPPDAPLEVGPLPTLSQGGLTFGCFNNLTKLNDAVLAVWSRVLHAVPDSRLILKAPQLRDHSVAASTRDRFARHDITDERLVLEQPASRADYLRAYHQVDIALDPFPYPGGTTSFEALWMGVPVLTRQGDRFLARAGETIMRNAGLPDWIASDNDDYVARAVRLAADIAGLARLRHGLRAQALGSPLFNAARFARHFEDAMIGMWNRSRT